MENLLREYVMQQILVYADSLSWGIIPGSRNRLAFEQRWPGIVEYTLVARERPVRVIEDCLNGRRTVLDDPAKPGRNGLQGLAQRIEVNSPLALVVLMLGTNDFQATHDLSAEDSAAGIGELIVAIRQAPVEPGMVPPAILVVAPPVVHDPQGGMAITFAGHEEKMAGLAGAYARVAQSLGCHFFDAQSVTPVSTVDGVHLDAAQHGLLGRALAERIVTLI